MHLHCTNQIALAYLILLRLTGVPVAVTAHVVTAHERTRVQDAVHRRIHRLSPLIIAHSEFDRTRLIEEFAIDPGRVIVIAHGEYGFFGHDAAPVEPEAARRQLGLDPGDEVALFFGYIREYKGLDVLLDAWPAVAKARPGARLVVAGDPVRLDAARRDALLAAATRVGAVHRFGYVPFSEVTGYFAAADVLVLPYRHVSQSGVLFLALAHGLPVVATRVGALPEVLRDGESGLLVPPESPGALAEALVRLFGDADLRRRLAAGGRAVAARHAWPAIAERTESGLGGTRRAGPPAGRSAGPELSDTPLDARGPALEPPDRVQRAAEHRPAHHGLDRQRPAGRAGRECVERRDRGQARHRGDHQRRGRQRSAKLAHDLTERDPQQCRSSQALRYE